jgi:hypothetical protein
MIRGLFSLALLLLVGGGVAAYMVAQSQPEAASGLPPVPASTEAATTFDEKVLTVQAAVDTAKETGKGQPITLVFTEAELTSKAAFTVSSLTGGLVPTDPQIHLRPGSIVFTAGISIQGFPLKLAVTAIPVLVDGRPTFSVDQIQTGLPLPDGIKKEIDAQIAKILSPESLGLAFDVTKIEVHQGRLVLEGTAKP